jgi:quinol monooxygenase YgiN
MIVVAGTISIDPAKRDAAMHVAQEMMAETRKEPGCVAYVMSGDFDDPGCIRLFEEWESDQAIAVHMKTPHMKKFQSQIPTLGFRGMKLDRYEIAKKAPLGGGK